MPRSLVGFFVLALSLSVNCLAAEAKERLAELFNNSEYEQLLDELKVIEKRDPSSFTSNNLDYFYARTAERNGNFSAAIAYYQKAAARDGELELYALKHLSRLMRETGNLGAERLFLFEIGYSEKTLIPNQIARQRLVRNYFESGDYISLITILEHGVPGVGKPEPVATDRQLQVLLGKSFLLNGQADKGREVFAGLVDSAPDENQPDDYSLEAVKGLDRIETGAAQIESVKNLTAEEHKRRADIYQFNRDFKHARLHYNAIVENHKENPMISEARYQIGRGFVQERKYEEAAPLFEAVRNDDPGADLKGPALYAAAGVYANLDKHSEAIAAYEQFISEYPDASNIERGYLNIIDAYRDAGNDKMALEWCSKTTGAFRGQKGEAAGLFAEVRIHIAGGDWNRALQSLNRLKELKDLGGMRIAGGTNPEEVSFLRALSLEKLGRLEDAVDVYIGIRDGRGEYYGWRSLDRMSKNEEFARLLERRLAKLKGKSGQLTGESGRFSEQEIQELEKILFPDKRMPAPKDPEDYAVLRIQPKAIKNLNGIPKRLLDLGLYDEAAPEAETRLRTRDGSSGEDLADFDDATAFTLATYYSRGGYADRAIKFIEPKWKKVDRYFPIEEIPNEQLMLLYPAPYRDALLKYGTEKDVDPRFLLSIMRQESRFQADIKSAAAARGLMQFITNTSDKMALELGIEQFRQDELYDPDTAVRFGAHYISKIFQDFPGQPQAVAASYNGGEDRMARWLKRAKTNDPDQYVPEIVFAQTKDYVERVMTNYRLYLLLYDKNLKPRVVSPRKKQAETLD